jgi:hypothetical protein
MAWVKLVNGIPIPPSDYWISSNNIDKKKIKKTTIKKTCTDLPPFIFMDRF